MSVKLMNTEDILKFNRKVQVDMGKVSAIYDIDMHIPAHHVEKIYADHKDFVFVKKVSFKSFLSLLKKH